MSDGPDYNNFIFAARNVLRALDHIGVGSSCLVGGMAIRLHGVRRDIKVRGGSEDLDVSKPLTMRFYYGIAIFRILI
jgi:hypothetical protein